MIELLTSPWSNRFSELIDNTVSSLLVCAPYIGRGPCERLTSALRRIAKAQPIDLFVLTDLSRDNMLSGATDVAAIASLVESFPDAVVRFLPSLHAKIYVSDSRQAVVTSANLTENGLLRNLEYGVMFSDPAEVARIRVDLLRYGELGSPITLSQLQAFATAAEELRSVRARAERSLRSKIRAEFDRKVEAMEVTVLRARAADRSLDAILSDAILYLLAERGMTTQEIHACVQRIHPDLCDDTIDRVIDGRSFGKKWKHAVRNAQSHLKKRGKIRLVGTRWVIAR